MERLFEAKGIAQGDKVVFTNQGGHAAEKKEVGTLLDVGRVLTVKWIEKGDGYLLVSDEFPKKGFDLDMFEKLPEDRDIQMGDIYRDDEMNEWVVVGFGSMKKLKSGGKEKRADAAKDMQLTRVLI